MTSTQVYPGMCDDSLEIFFNHEMDVLMAIKDGQIIPFESLQDSDINFLRDIIHNEQPVRDILSGWFTEEHDQIKKLAKCRFGGLNFTPDYSDGVAQPDVINNCPHTASCQGFGHVCKSIAYQGFEMSATDIRAVQLLTSSIKNSVIAETLDMPPGSFETYRTRLYKNLGGITTKQELARVAFRLGLV